MNMPENAIAGLCSVDRKEVLYGLAVEGVQLKHPLFAFRHPYSTILKSHGEDVKTVQELMRHANSSVTLNL